jgi:hypothetical protein
MENKLETLELELLQALAEEQRCQERMDDYQGYIQSFTKLKNNLYEEWCDIRSRVREKNEEIILSKLPFSKGDRYKVIDLPAFNEIKIERIEIENWMYPKKESLIRFYLRGKFKLTNKWRDIDKMSLEEFQSIITTKVQK